MKRQSRRGLLLGMLLAAACGGTTPTQTAPPPAATAPAPPPADPLASWNEGAARKAIVDFVGRVTREGGPDFVPPPERIATFDNDGTLWAEKPVPFQVAVRARPRQGAGAAAPGVEDEGAVRPAAQGRHGRSRRRRREGRARSHRRHAHRHDDRRIRRTVRTGSPRRSIRRRGGSTPRWSTSRCSNCSPICGQRFQDVHRLGRRRRVHAAVGGTASMASRPSR